MFQSTFPQGERPRGDSVIKYGYFVSIHVPARGTTLLPLWRVQMFSLFQSTFPQGERLPHRRSDALHGIVSIHVPARGTTYIPSSVFRILPLFQSTFPQGERLCLLPSVPGSSGFNPRSRKGNDPLRSSRSAPFSGFNPRSRKGNDEMTSSDTTVTLVSIHVPARGTTAITYNFYL